MNKNIKSLLIFYLFVSTILGMILSLIYIPVQFYGAVIVFTICLYLFANTINDIFAFTIKETVEDKIEVIPETISQHHIYTDSIKRIGVFQKDHYPDYAEEMNLSKYTVGMVKRGENGGNVFRRNDVYYTCPKCKTIHQLRFEHGDMVRCLCCNLKSQTYGNGLWIWE